MEKQTASAPALSRMIREEAEALLGPWPKGVDIFIFSIGISDWRCGFSPARNPVEAEYLAGAFQIAVGIRTRFDLKKRMG
jgi:hypothetical protein